MQKLSLFDSIVVWGSIVLVCFRLIKFLPAIPSTLYYASFGLLAVLVIIKGEIKINFIALLFLLFCFLSIIGNVIPSYFHVHERFLGMFLLTFFLGPLINNNWISNIRLAIIKRLCWVLSGITVISFLLYFIYKPITLTERGQLFGGITVHSMIMGPIAGLSLVFLVNFLFNNQNVLYKWQKYLLSIAAFMCFGSCVLAGSRSALLATVTMGVCWIWFYTSDVKKFIKLFSIVLFLVISTFPLWWTYTETIQMKMKYAESKGSVYASRENLWTTRISEAESSPILGIGFATVSFGTSHAPSNYDGNVEPGNGWLFVLSSTGVISFLLLLFLYIKACRNLYRKRDEMSICLLCFLIFYSIHLNAEGYTLSAGAPMFFFFWLTLGTSYAYLNAKDAE